MELLRNSQTREAAEAAYKHGQPENRLRSYHLPEYQLEMIDVLARESGLSKAGVIRQIIDEWYRLKLGGNGSK